MKLNKNLIAILFFLLLGIAGWLVADRLMNRQSKPMLTGGGASFGVGGYFLSALDPILPVSMEMRQEHRKLGIAMAIVMDRSGSMSVPVAGGQTKMDLANLGAAAAIELLSPMDSVGVIAVDSEPHVIQGLTRVEDRGDLISTVRRVESMGGGIYVYSDLEAAWAFYANGVTSHSPGLPRSGYPGVSKAEMSAPQPQRGCVIADPKPCRRNPLGFEIGGGWLGRAPRVARLRCDTQSPSCFIFGSAGFAFTGCAFAGSSLAEGS